MRPVLYNGISYNSDSPIIQAANLLFENQQGLIETILFKNGCMPLWEGHCKRIKASFQTLAWPFSSLFLNQLLQKIREQTQAYPPSKALKIRICFFLEEKQIHYLLEIQEIPPERKLLRIGIAKGLTLNPGKWSFMKSNEREMYNRALLQATNLSLQDMLLLNQLGRIAESTIANVFWEKEHQLFTPPLSEGCVAGVYRAALLSHTLTFEDKEVREKPLTIREAMEADALYLTNAIRGIQKVDQLVF